VEAARARQCEVAEECQQPRLGDGRRLGSGIPSLEDDRTEDAESELGRRRQEGWIARRVNRGRSTTEVP